MRASAIFALALPVLAVATAMKRNDGECDTGSIMCCSSTQSSTTTGLAELAGLLGISLGDLTPVVGLTCSGLDVGAIGGTSCSQQPACCTGNTFAGLITLGCNPINLNA